MREYKELMYTPYDWQEGIGNRAQYIESKLKQGSPVLAVSLDEGLLVFTYRRQARKIYEVYDRLIFGAVGQQSDIEAIRTAAVEFAHQEGYNRSEEDVTIQRVATALSAPLKKAFSDFSASPLVARSLFAEVNATVDEDVYYVLDYDGDFQLSRRFAVAAGSDEAGDVIRARLADLKPKTSPDKAVETLKDIWLAGMSSASEDSGRDALDGLKAEAVLVSRAADREDRFKTLIREEF